MEFRNFEMTLISANDLEEVRRTYKMKVYAIVSLGSEGRNQTPTDENGTTNPEWNFRMEYIVREPMLEDYVTMLVVKLYCKRLIHEDRYIGEVHMPMKELYDTSKDTGGSSVRSFPILKGSKESQGELNFSYKFGEKETIDKSFLDEGEFVEKPSGEESTKGKWRRFPWMKAIKMVAKGVIMIYTAQNDPKKNIMVFVKLLELKFSHKFGEKETPSGEESTKGKWRRFPWMKVIEMVAKGIIMIYTAQYDPKMMIMVFLNILFFLISIYTPQYDPDDVADVCEIVGLFAKIIDLFGDEE